MPDLTFTIGEVAHLLGLTPKAIRHYHKIGLLAPPDRDTNNYRLYGMAQIEQLQRIIQLKRFGLSLEQIRIIMAADHPDALVQTILRQHADNLRDEIARLQQQLAVTERFLDTRLSIPMSDVHNPVSCSAMTALADAIKPQASGVADILVAVEQDVMRKLDYFGWHEDYELFWHRAGRHFVGSLREESNFIFWMERYLALAAMSADDLQGRAWLQELHGSPARRMLAHALLPTAPSVLPAEDQQLILKLLPSLLYQEASPLQKQFLELLVGR